MIKAIIFDIDGVLIDSIEANFNFISDYAKIVNLKAPSRKEYFKKFYYQPTKEVFRITNNITDLYELELKLKKAHKIVPSYFHLVNFFEGCNETIHLLSKKYKLAIVSSRTNRGLKQYLKFAKTKKYFKVIVGLEHVTNHKPHPEPLLLAIKKLNVEANEAIYIGDAPTDAQAAHAAGMKAIILNQRKIKDADIQIKKFDQLVSAINKIENVQK